MSAAPFPGQLAAQPEQRRGLAMSGAPWLLRLRAGEAVSLGDEIDPQQREQLTAYGLAANRPFKVLQQRPMTVILAEEVELALEHEVARHIWVKRKQNENDC